MSNANAFIYLLTDPRNNEAVYIGKTTEPTTRLRNHIKRPCSAHSRLEADIAVEYYRPDEPDAAQPELLP